MSETHRCSLRWRVGTTVLLWLIAFCAHRAPGQSVVQLHDVTETSGITFVHTDGGSGRRYIVETVSAGLAVFDYDLDGDLDVYFLNGRPLKGTRAETPPRNALYRNDGAMRFSDVTETAGVGDAGFGLGVTVADFDQDGDRDLYLNNYGANVFYRNNGDGTFSDAAAETGTANGDKVGAGACFLDADRDGDLDLYVSNYLDFTYEAVGPVTWRGVPVYAAPELFPPTPDVLYRNNGDGTFTDVSRASGIGQHSGWGMGMMCADFDNDGDTDVMVGNDSNRNFVFENDGTGRFEEIGLLSGLAYDHNGDPQASMGVGCGDYNNDGWLDFYVTSYQRQMATLYRNLGGGLFDDVTLSSGAGQGTYEHVTWGTDIIDFDNDGHRDIFVACGHLMDRVEEFDDTTGYHARNVLLMNQGNGRFRDVSSQAGNGMQVKLTSRGTAFDDLDNDGDVDVVVLNSRRESTVLRNKLASKRHWLQVYLRGIETNRDGVGARVRVVAGDLVQIAEVHSGRGYQSHYGMRLNFGLGSQTAVDRVDVRWIGGRQDNYQNVPVDQSVTLFEGGRLVP